MLIIFDCDGVLVDSEIISSEVTADLLTEVGYKITWQEINERFVGMTGPEIAAAIEADWGRALPEDLRARTNAEIDRRLAAVKPIKGVHQLLDSLDLPRAIASNSGSARLKITLSATKLYDRFKPYIFSAGEVGSGRGKPAPDVYLHAARHFEIEPRDCIVVEDSVPGVTAGVAAGMRVIGFTGGSHSWPGHGEHLMDAGAETIVKQLHEIPAVVEAFKVWSGFSD